MHISRRTKTCTTGLTIALWLCIGNAQADEHYDGYSYAAFGVQSVSYSEHPSLVPFKTQVHTSNIAFISGGLFKVTDQLDFSLDTSSSLINNPSNEHWSSDAPNTWNNTQGSGSIGSGTVVQTDRFMMDVGSIRALLQYKYTPQLRMVGGLTYLSLDSKRSLPTTNYPSLINTNNSLVDERDDTFSASFGLAWESGGLADNLSRWRVRSVVDLPLFRQVTNSQIINPITAGYDWGMDISAAYDIRVYKGLEVGFLSDYFFRWGNSTPIPQSTGNAEYPQHQVSQWFAGIEFGWNLGRSIPSPLKH